MARKERQLHLQLYPGWTARDNYAANQKKKKKKRDKSSDGGKNKNFCMCNFSELYLYLTVCFILVEGGALKKCRARFGLDQQNNWCKPCRLEFT